MNAVAARSPSTLIARLRRREEWQFFGSAARLPAVEPRLVGADRRTGSTARGSGQDHAGQADLAPEEAILAALAEADADGLTGLDTVLGNGYEGGTDLSGGQWQRVAVARAPCAVRQGAGVIVLDEHTAQLDVRGETEIFERILGATRGRTTVLISHRFSTARRADRICVLAAGRSWSTLRSNFRRGR